MWSKSKRSERKGVPLEDDDDDDSVPPPPPPAEEDYSPKSYNSHSEHTEDYTSEDGSATQNSKKNPPPTVRGHRTVSGTSKHYTVKQPFQKAVAAQALEEEEAGMDDVEVHNSPVVNRINADERKRKLRILLIIILVVLVAIVLVAALGGGLGSRSSSSNSQKGSGPNGVDFFINSLGVSENSVFQNSSSPQYRALSWLKTDTANLQYQFEKSLTTDATLQLTAKQLYAAATLYYSLGGPSWNNNTGWLSSASICNWYGIFCRKSTTIVETLLLDQQNLVGEMPREIQLFTDLVQISMFNNSIAGSIPSSLCSLSMLQYLDLSINDLTGQIPSNIGQLTEMTYMYLGDNRLSGKIPAALGLLTQLKQLWMGNNGYYSNVATIPSEIGNLSNLTSLDLQNMGGYGLRGGIGGSIPSEIGKCKQLVMLRLNNNDLGMRNSTSYGSKVPSELGMLSKLTMLDLSSTYLSGILPSSLVNLKSLTVLRLDNCLFSGSMPSFVANLTSLVTLTLNNNKWNATYYRSAGFNGSIPTFLANLKSAQRITLQGNSFAGSVPSSVCQALTTNTITVCKSINTCTCCNDCV